MVMADAYYAPGSRGTATRFRPTARPAFGLISGVTNLRERPLEYTATLPAPYKPERLQFLE